MIDSRQPVFRELSEDSVGYCCGWEQRFSSWETRIFMR